MGGQNRGFFASQKRLGDELGGGDVCLIDRETKRMGTEPWGEASERVESLGLREIEGTGAEQKERWR